VRKIGFTDEQIAFAVKQADLGISTWLKLGTMVFGQLAGTRG
jgi:hypothetical protein